MNRRLNVVGIDNQKCFLILLSLDLMVEIGFTGGIGIVGPAVATHA
jgi:hypothetical protein